MSPADPPVDPNHESKRAALAKLGMGLMALGVPCGLVGFGLFFSAFLSMPLTPARPAAGIALMAVGGLATMFGLQMLMLGNMGRIVRYQAGEMMPVAEDLTRSSSPLVSDMARAASTGWAEGQGQGELHDHKVQHSCGAWIDPADAFCKGCGQPVAGRVCPACQARNDPDAHFCERCGQKIPA